MHALRSSSYDAWLVDLDGTLYHALPVRSAMAVELLLGHWHLVRRLQNFRREQENMRGELQLPELNLFQMQLTRAAKSVEEAAELEQIVRKWMIERPCRWLRLFRRRWLLKEIARFRSRGGRTALISDYPAALKLTSLRCDKLFDVVVASGERGGQRHLKPHPDGLLRAAQQLNIAPSRCLVLGDRPDVDGIAAHRAGMSFQHIHTLHHFAWLITKAKQSRSPGGSWRSAPHPPSPSL